MKLRKLIPTLSSLGVLASAAPIVFTTSCSCVNNLRDVNIKDGYNPGTKQAPKNFNTRYEMVEEYMKLSSKDKAKDYIWSMSKTLESASSTQPEIIPFTFKTLTSAHVTMESWFTKSENHSIDGVSRPCIETSYQYIFTVSGVSGKSATSYIPEGCDVNYEVNFEVSNLPYTFSYGDYKYEGQDSWMLTPISKKTLQSTDDWHVSAQVIATYKKKYTDTESVTRMDTLSVYWDHDNMYDVSKESEYKKKSYLYPILYRHLFYKSFFFQDHTCEGKK